MPEPQPVLPTQLHVPWNNKFVSQGVFGTILRYEFVKLQIYFAVMLFRYCKPAGKAVFYL